MININIHNYEEFVLDYLENNLSADKKEEFVVFINNHPEIKEEIESISEVDLVAEEISFAGKKFLKKELSIDDINVFDYLCVASLEGDLSEEENESFLRSIEENTKKKADFEVYKKTKLEADTSIVYKKKSTLRKSGKNVRLYYYISIASSILILVALYLFIPKGMQELPIAESQIVNTGDQNNVIQALPKTNSSQEFIVSNSAEEKKEEFIGPNQTIIKETSNKVKAEDLEPSQRNKDNIAYVPMQKLETIYTEISVLNTNRNLAEVKAVQIDFNNTKDYVNVRSYIAQSFNKRVLNKDKNKLELFDIAQASVNGLNKVFGGNMKLERVYNEKGEHDKTQFTSNLVAISTPVKNK